MERRWGDAGCEEALVEGDASVGFRKCSSESMLSRGAYDDDSSRTLCMARSRREEDVVVRPTEWERRWGDWEREDDEGLRRLPCRSKLLLRFCSSTRRLYSRARSSTEDRLLCVDL